MVSKGLSLDAKDVVLLFPTVLDPNVFELRGFFFKREFLQDSN